MTGQRGHDALAQAFAGHQAALVGGRAEQVRHRVRSLGHVGVPQDGEGPGRRVLDETHGRLEHHPERALGADQEPVEPAPVLGKQVLEGVARDLAPEAPELGAHRAEVLVDQGIHEVVSPACRARRHHRAIGEQDGEPLDVVDRAAVGERSRAAGVVADHPADRAARVGRGIGAEAEPSGDRLLLQHRVHDAGLDARGPRFGVEGEHPAEVATGVHDDAAPDGVAGDRGAGAAHRQRGAGLPRDRHRGDELVGVAWAYDDPGRDPVERGVTGVERAGKGGVVDVADAGLPQCVDDLVCHHSSRERVRMPAASSSVTSRGAVASSRCCFMVPSTRSSTSPLS